MRITQWSHWFLIVFFSLSTSLFAVFANFTDSVGLIRKLNWTATDWSKEGRRHLAEREEERQEAAASRSSADDEETPKDGDMHSNAAAVRVLDALTEADDTAQSVVGAARARIMHDQQ